MGETSFVPQLQDEFKPNPKKTDSMDPWSAGGRAQSPIATITNPPGEHLQSHPSISLSAAEALGSPTPYLQPDPPGQGWADETPASSRSPPATSPLPAWGCWVPVGCWAPHSAALPPALPSSSKADRLVLLVALWGAICGGGRAAGCTEGEN